MDKVLIIHYQPGGRGDFFAGAMYDTLKESNDGSIKRPTGTPYKNVHVVDDYSFLDTPDTVKVRISSGLFDENNQWNGSSIEPSLQIAHNWFIKHAPLFARNPHYKDMQLCEKYYHCVHFFCFYDMQGQPYRSKYDHWLDFKDINDIEFLNAFRLKVYGTSIPEETRIAMQQNIDRQPVWQKSDRAEMIEQVRKLIDQELEQGIFLGPTWDHIPVEEKLALLKT